jgi:hypothetical protein
LGDVPAPSVQADQVVTAVPAVSAGDVPVPALSAGATVAAVPALSAGQVPRPVISPAPSGGSSVVAITTTFAEDSA